MDTRSFSCYKYPAEPTEMAKGMVVKEFATNKLILPKQPHHDDFLLVMNNVFQYSCWFGIAGSKKLVWRLWSVLVFVVLMIIQCEAVWKVVKALAGWAVDTVGHRSVTARFAGTFFYAIAILSLILGSRLYASWSKLSAYWAIVEKSVAVSVPPDKMLRRRMVTVVAFMTGFCFFEHIMSIISLVGLDCPPELILKRYTLLSHGFMILRSAYEAWMAIPILFVSTLATALWNYQDLLIVLISMGLTSRYHRLNSCVANVCSLEKRDVDGNETVHLAKKIREAYVKQAKLVRKMDGALGIMVILSSFFNFYFICLQLFLGITQGKYVSGLRRLYFVVSLAWLIIRVSSVVLAAASVNVHSKSALKYIYDIDASCFNIEMQRLQKQLTKDFVALSGMGFFYLNRTILLKMAGSIITYELMLIQFDDVDFTDTNSVLTANLTHN